MIRVDDPSQVALTMTVRDAAVLREVVSKATSAAIGIVFSEEERELWKAFQNQLERATVLQQQIYRQLYSGHSEGSGEGIVLRMPLHVLPALKHWWEFWK